MCGFFDQVVSDVHKTNRVAQNEREREKQTYRNSNAMARARSCVRVCVADICTCAGWSLAEALGKKADL